MKHDIFYINNYEISSEKIEILKKNMLNIYILKEILFQHSNI